MRQYLDLLRHIRDNGTVKKDRTGIGTRSIFGAQIRFDLADDFPLVTTKRVYTRALIHELLWFLRGDTHIRYLVQNDVNIWNEWAFERYLAKAGIPEPERYSEVWQQELGAYTTRVKENAAFAEEYSDLGPVYGKQWVRWAAPDGSEVNQITESIETIKNDPFSRRIIVSGWNVGELQELIKSKNFAPPSCHTLFQFMVIEGKLSCQLYQRSGDMFLGVPLNIASYALLTMMMAQVTGLEPGEFVHTFGDAHIYLNHLEQVDLQLSREPRPLPTMRLNPEVKDIFAFTYEDFALEGYKPWPAIKAPIAV